MDLQLTSMSQHNRCHIWYIVSYGKVTDNFVAHTLATTPISNTCTALFKNTPDKITLKVDTFITTGLPGVLHMTGKSSLTKVKSEIQAAVLNGFCEYNNIIPAYHPLTYCIAP